MSDDELEPCGGCGRTATVSFSPLWGWLCTNCRHVKTEQWFLRQPHTDLPVRPDEPGVKQRSHP